MKLDNCVFQILIADQPVREFPEYISNCVESVHKYLPNYQHHFYQNDELFSFLKENFGLDVLYAYEKLKPYAYKADLARYCLLYTYGGWYIDLTLSLQCHLTIDGSVRSLVFRDFQYASGNPWSCTNGLIFFRNNDPVLLNAINRIVENCRINFYGKSPLCPTGPSLLGQCLAEMGSDASRIFGEHVHLTPGYQKKNPAFILPDGTIYCKRGELNFNSLADFGISGSNNYTKMYCERDIYHIL